MRSFAFGVALAAVASSAVVAAEQLPSPANFLFWTPSEQAVGYRSIEKIFPTSAVKRSGSVRELPASGKPFDVSYDFQNGHWDTDAFMQANRVSGLLVVKDGKVVLERYGLGRGPQDRWTSFSVAKSVTSTLVGAAIRDGSISGLDAMVTTYIPELKGSAYDGVSVRDLITMRSGAKWDENYADPKSDVNRLIGQPFVPFMKQLTRAHKPGTVFNYNSGETNLVGVLVMQATHKSLADYLSEKIWSRMGAEQDALWIKGQDGNEAGGCCISMSLRDYARFALFFMEGGKDVLPDGWVQQASSKQTPSDFGDLGYGFLWWTHDDGTYEAIGIFGQSIFISPRENLVIVTNSAWPEADSIPRYIIHDAYMAAVRKALAK